MKTTTVKSLALVAVAVLIGLGVLNTGYNDPDVEFSGANPTETPKPDDVPTALPEPTVDPGLTAPGSVQVLVANATSVSGLAGAISETLVAGPGYSVLPATNANEGTNGLRSVIYYAAGSESAAQGVARALGLDPNAVLAMPPQPPVPDASGADVLVIAGDDLTPT